MNVQKKDQITQIGTDGVDIPGPGGDEWVGFGVEHRGESIEDETRMVQ